MKRATVVSLQSLTSLALAHLVKYYVTMMMYLAPVCFPGVFIGPTKSVAHLSNACRVNFGANGILSLRDGFPALWHTSQALEYFLASLCKVGHERPALITFCTVAFPAYCPPACLHELLRGSMFILPP
jgi:hypothetical protein